MGDENAAAAAAAAAALQSAARHVRWLPGAFVCLHIVARRLRRPQYDLRRSTVAMCNSSTLLLTVRRQDAAGVREYLTSRRLRHPSIARDATGV